LNWVALIELVDMVEIRNATSEDRDAIELLTRLLISERKENFDSKRFEWGILRRLYDQVQRHGIFIAEEINEKYKQKKAVGMIVAEIRVDPFGYSEGYIKQFFVKPDYRKHGYGQMLLNTAINHLKQMNIQRIKVNVKKYTQEGTQLYNHLNFKPKYVVMELDLKGDSLDTTKSIDEEVTIAGFEPDEEDTEKNI
jgi:ribosomal protein S18 acetylase RimI-like enzyme